MVVDNRDVFINCPFDPEYQAFFHAIVFVVIRSGFRPRCALETDDAAENRFDKRFNILWNWAFFSALDVSAPGPRKPSDASCSTESAIAISDTYPTFPVRTFM